MVGLYYFLDFAWFIGLFVSLMVFTYRAGLQGDNPLRRDVHWLEFMLPNKLFFLLVLGKAYVWPIVLVVWLCNGCRRSPWIATSVIDGRPVRAVLRREEAVAVGLIQA